MGHYPMRTVVRPHPWTERRVRLGPTSSDNGTAHQVLWSSSWHVPAVAAPGLRWSLFVALDGVYWRWGQGPTASSPDGTLVRLAGAECEVAR